MKAFEQTQRHKGTKEDLIYRFLCGMICKEAVRADDIIGVASTTCIPKKGMQLAQPNETLFYFCAIAIRSQARVPIQHPPRLFAQNNTVTRQIEQMMTNTGLEFELEDAKEADGTNNRSLFLYEANGRDAFEKGNSDY